MNILRILKTMMATKGLEVLLLGKEVITPNEISLGIVTAIKKELSQDKIWMVVENQGSRSILPIEQIASVTSKVILFDELPLLSLAARGNLGFSD